MIKESDNDEKMIETGNDKLRLHLNLSCSRGIMTIINTYLSNTILEIRPFHLSSKIAFPNGHSIEELYWL